MANEPSSSYARWRAGASFAKTCRVCGVGFRGGPNRHRCDACRVVSCRFCGTRVIQVGDTQPRVICGKSECRATLLRLAVSKPKLAKTCRVCRKNFEVPPCRAARRYCSRECAAREIGEKIAAVTSQARKSEEYRRAQSERTRAGWGRSEVRLAHAAADARPEVRARRSKSASMRRPEVRAKVSASLRASERHKLAMRNRPIPPSPNWQEYRGVRMRSKWERDFAVWLDACDLAWVYEPERLILSDGRSYTPDFSVHVAGRGPVFVELHRMRMVKPGDERKVAKLLRARDELAGAKTPLLLFDEMDVACVQRAVRRLARAEGVDGGG